MDLYRSLLSAGLCVSLNANRNFDKTVGFRNTRVPFPPRGDGDENSRIDVTTELNPSVVDSPRFCLRLFDSVNPARGGRFSSRTLAIDIPGELFRRRRMHFAAYATRSIISFVSHLSADFFQQLNPFRATSCFSKLRGRLLGQAATKRPGNMTLQSKHMLHVIQTCTTNSSLVNFNFRFIGKQMLREVCPSICTTRTAISRSCFLENAARTLMCASGGIPRGARHLYFFQSNTLSRGRSHGEDLTIDGRVIETNLFIDTSNCASRSWEIVTTA